ncbi:MAG: hypothetical protein SFW62_07320 [Alphaproteobacteria bacterium]|nr:hypothetical protein [Alphaproteobacteria bacterium]
MRGLFPVLRLLALPALLILPGFAAAQEGGDGTLHVLRPVIHAEREKAELCLEFDHDLDPDNGARLGAGAHLKAGRKTTALTSSSASSAGRLLCVQGLEHGQDYRLSIASLRGAKGEKLDGPYNLSFSIPDRRASLVFAGAGGGFVRWQGKNPVLRAMNVPQADIELYRVSDPAFMAQAWREKQQTSLAPSESAYLARERGTLLWKGALVLGDARNQDMEQKIPLRAVAGDMPPGLYLLVAHGDKAESEDEDSGPAPMAAVWLLHSDLKLNALRDTKGFYALAETGDAPAKDVQLLVFDRKGQSLSEGKSGDDGVAFFPFSADKAPNAALITGLTAAGDVDFVNLDSAETQRLALTRSEIALTTDKPFYPPGTDASVTLTAHDIFGKAMPVSGSTLKLLRPDKSLYASLPVPNGDSSGSAKIPLSVPAASGVWPLVWQSADGAVLAENVLRVASSRDAPRFEMSADRAMLSPEGEVHLAVKSLTHDEKPAPFLPGRIFVSWAVPDRAFPGWDNYRFGTGAANASDATAVASFITDDKGAAHLRLKLTPPENTPALRSAILNLQPAPGAEAAAPKPLALPMAPRDFTIGVKPLAADGRFAENGAARFSIVALDIEGRRRAVDSLTYQIYEEGRSFEWYQSEGRWSYRPQQQKRRIGGGPLTLDADGENIIDWPVTAGSYRLEITRATGGMLAAVNFSAGWAEAETQASSRLPLNLSASSKILKPGQAAILRFTLDKPSMVNIFIGDDHVRKVAHQFMPAGAHEFSFTPEKNWGRQITARVEMRGFAGELILPLTPDGKEPAETTAEESGEALKLSAQFPAFLRAGDSANLSLRLEGGKIPEGSYRYAVSAGADGKITNGGGTVALAPGRARDIVFTLKASQPGTASIKAEISGPARMHASATWSLPIAGQDTVLKVVGEDTLRPEESWPPAAGKKSAAKTLGDFILIGARPLFDTPILLSDVLNAPPVTTAQIAGRMDMLRLWRDVILATKLLSESVLDAKRRDLRLRLLARQMPDGGFPSLPGAVADMPATAAALVALAQDTPDAARLGLEQAASWLQHRLENSWFEEGERPQRAAAYAALASAGRLNIANLHYFADTSADKSLPPLAALQLAYAFAHIDDQNKTQFWLNAAAVNKDSPDISVTALPLLAENRFFDPQVLLPALEKSSGAAAKSSGSSVGSMIGLLRAIRAVHERAGGWRVTIGNDKRSPKTVLTVPVPEKTTGFSIRNTNDAPLFFAAVKSANATGAPVLARRIYKMNGTEAAAEALLSEKETYLVVLEGPWTGNSDAPLHLHDAPGPGLRPAGCLPEAPLEVGESLAWLRSHPPGPAPLCEIWGGSVDFMLTRAEGPAMWRAAYLARADQSGEFAWPAPWAQQGQNEPIQGLKSRITIR